MNLKSSGVRQPNIWASVVSNDAPALREWLLALGFTEDLFVPGENLGAVHHCQLDWPEGARVILSSVGEPCNSFKRRGAQYSLSAGDEFAPRRYGRTECWVRTSDEEQRRSYTSN